MNNPNMNNSHMVKQIMQNKMNQQLNAKDNNQNMFKACGNGNDFLTQVGHKNNEGYDVTGCRYDFKESPQNNSVYGPPLAWCDTYDKSKLQKTGTLWYPLNG